jgi:hypothetical protein
VDGSCSTHGEMGSVYSVLVGRPEGKRPQGGSKRRWEGNIKMYLREVRLDGGELGSAGTG